MATVYGAVRSGGIAGAIGAALSYNGTYWVPFAQLPTATVLGTAEQAWTADGQIIQISTGPYAGQVSQYASDGNIVYVGNRPCVNLASYAANPDANGNYDAGIQAAMNAAVAADLPLYCPALSATGVYLMGGPCIVPGSLAVEGPSIIDVAGGIPQPFFRSRGFTSPSAQGAWGAGGGWAGAAFITNPTTLVAPVQYLNSNNLWWVMAGGSASAGHAVNPTLFLSEVPFSNLNGLTAMTLEYAVNALGSVPVATIFPFCGGSKSAHSTFTNALRVDWSGSGPFDLVVTLTTAGGVLVASTAGAPFALNTDYSIALTYDGTHLKLFAGAPNAAPTITATSAAGSGAIVQQPWEDFIWGASPQAGQWPFGTTNGTGHLRFGNIRLSNTAHTITTLRGTEFGAADVLPDTCLICSFAPANQYSLAGLIVASGCPSNYNIPTSIPAATYLQWRNAFIVGAETAPRVSFRNIAVDTWTDAFLTELAPYFKIEDCDIVGCRRGITVINNSFYCLFKNIRIACSGAASAHSWGIGMFEDSGLAVIDNINFGSQCSSTAGLVMNGGGGTMKDILVNTANGQWACYFNGGQILLLNVGAGDEGGLGVKDAIVLFNQCTNVTWIGGGTLTVQSASAKAQIIVDGGVNYNFDINMGAAPATSPVLMVSPSAPLLPVRLACAYQGQSIEVAIPWSDGTCPVKIMPLEESGRTVWNAVNSSSITCQWFTSANAFGTPIAQGAGGGPTGPDFSCETIVITDTGVHLVGTTAVVAPTKFTGFRRRFVNSTLQPLTFGAASGAVVTVAAGKSAVLESNGSGWERVTADV